MKRFIAVTGVLVALAFAFDDGRLVQFSIWLIYGMLTMSLVFIWGQAGILVFGQSAFFGVAAYTYGIVAINFVDLLHETLTAILVGVAVAAVFAAALGYFMFYGRVGSVYLAIVTLAVSLVIGTWLAGTAGPQYRVGHALLGGYNGMTGIPPVTLGILGRGGFPLGPQHAYMFFAVLASASYGLLTWLLRQPFGRIVVSIRENELRSELLGYDVRRYRLLAFVIGGSSAGLAGACFAAWGRFVNPAVFGLEQSALLIIWLLVGGRQSLAGGFFGAAFVQWLTTFLGSGAGGRQTQLILGGLMIAIVLGLPNGCAGLVGRLLRPRERARAPTPGARTASQATGLAPRAPGRAAPQAPTITAASTTTAPAGALLRVNDLAKSFDGLRAVDGVTLSLDDREVRCLIGPNGAGKSTFFNMLVGRHVPSAGTITFAGRNVSKLPPHRRAQMGIAIKLQVPGLYPGLPVWENMWLAAYGRVRNRAAADETTVRILEAVRLADRAHDQACNLSHGEQQRLEMGMVQAASPSLVLLDEPTAGMTRDETRAMVDMVRSMATTAGVIVVEHDMEFVRRLDAPVTVLHQGRILVQGSVSAVRADARVLDVYLGRDSRAARR